MPLILPGNVASATAGAFSVDNSCRYNRPDNPDLSRTPGSDGNRQVYTISCWIKRGALGTFQPLFSANNNFADFDSDNTFRVGITSGGAVSLETNRLFRDCSAWYHIVVKVDTTQGAAADRLRLYVNGVEETSFVTDVAVVQDYETDMNLTGTSFEVLHDGGGTRTMDGYAAEFVLLDGTAAAPTEFGEFDEDSPTIWKPKNVSGLTFGTNGLYLNFSDSADLGADSSGNGNDLTVANLDATDQATDTPTNNFCTMNPLDNYHYGSTFSQGNCYVVTNAGNKTWNTSTIALTTGKWYWETEVAVLTSSWEVGIAPRVSESSTEKLGDTATTYSFEIEDGATADGHNVGGVITDLRIDSNDVNDRDGARGDILSFYLDLDNNLIYYAHNGNILNSGTGIAITAPASTIHGHYFIACGDHGAGACQMGFNFGGCAAWYDAVSSAVSDANGYGNFEYDPSRGGASDFDSSAKDFLAICTKNLGSDGG